MHKDKIVILNFFFKRSIASLFRVQRETSSVETISLISQTLTVLADQKFLRYGKLMLINLLTFAGGVHAQSSTNFDPPSLKLVDNVGISLVSGKAQFSLTPVSIGPKENALALNLIFNGHATWAASADGFAGEIYQSTNHPDYEIAVNLFHQSDVFRNGSTSDFRQTGSSLTLKPDGSYEYMSRDGVRYIADSTISGWRNENCCINMAITKVVYPTGKEINIHRSSASGTPILSVTTNFGYQLRYTYAPTGELIKVTAVNLAVDYCNSTSVSCTYSRDWPAATFLRESAIVNLQGPTTLTVTDSANKVTKYFTEDGYDSYAQLVYHYSRLTSVKWPSSSSASNVTLGYGNMIHCEDGSTAWICNDLRGSIVTSAVIGSGHWTYSYFQPAHAAPYSTGLDGLWTTTATSQEGAETKVKYDIKKGTTHNVWSTSGNRVYDPNLPNRLLTASDSEGRNFSFTHDARGNVLTKTQIGISGTPSLVRAANYDVVCTNRVTCNKPNWVKDANGSQTDYTYDPVHGGVLTETSPADVNGVRPQIRNTYIQRYAFVKSSTGGYVSAGQPIWLLSTSKICRTSTATASGCQAPNDEVETTYDYGPSSGPNNLSLRGKSVTADGVTRRICSSHDALGNVVSETTANANLTTCT